MTEAPRATVRRSALSVALESMPGRDLEGPLAALPVSGAQWQRSVSDADLDGHAAAYSVRRLDFVSSVDSTGPAVAKRLRPAALELAGAARSLCARLELLSSLEPGGEAPRTAHALRNQVAADARDVVSVAIDGVDPPPEPAWLALPAVSAADDRDVLLTIFGIDTAELTDDAGSFCDARLLAHYRLRLAELQRICNPILGLVADQAPSVFTAASAARDLATSVSPLVTLQSARDIRARILRAFAADSARTIALFSVAARDMDKEWSSFARLQDRLRRTEVARTERDRAVSVLEAYKHMSEGITRRWVWLLLQLSGLDGPMPTVGRLTEPAAARLGELGTHIGAALVPAMRNAEAHEEFEFDEDSGLLVAGDATFASDEIVARLTDLDVLQRGLTVGRLAAFADEPGLAGGSPGASVGPSASSAVSFARQRFGHAGQRVRSFVRDRDRLDVVIDGLRPEACNPCFVALTQAAQILPTVSQFVVRVPGREVPIIDLPAGVLHTNWPVFERAARIFPDALPQSTFLPCLTWVRLSCESIEDASRIAAWMALNDAQHAILDAEVAPRELVRLPERLRLVAAAAAASARVLPQGPHLDALLRAQQMTRATARSLHDGGPYGIATTVLIDGMLRARDRLGGPPAILPTLDRTPLREGSHPHETS